MIASIAAIWIMPACHALTQNTFEWRDFELYFAVAARSGEPKPTRRQSGGEVICR
jgi:hypothetical protein